MNDGVGSGDRFGDPEDSNGNAGRTRLEPLQSMIKATGPIDDIEKTRCLKRPGHRLGTRHVHEPGVMHDDVQMRRLPGRINEYRPQRGPGWVIQPDPGIIAARHGKDSHQSDGCPHPMDQIPVHGIPWVVA